MQENPKISILIPIYGVERYIARCARSLFEQSYNNIEYVFVNDCTKDDSISILKKVIQEYPHRQNQVKLINHEKNQGLGGTRLTGLVNSTCEYVWFVDSDDYIEPNALEIIIDYIKKGYDYIVFNYYIETKDEIIRFYNQGLNVENALYQSVTPSIWKCVTKRNLFFDNGILPVPGINQSEDYLLTSRLILVARSPILVQDHFIYHYNLTNVNSYVNNVTTKSMENCVDTCLIVYDFYKKRDFRRKYRVSFAVAMSLWYIEFEKLEACNSKCRLLLDLIRETDWIVAFIMRLTFFPREKLVRAYRKIYIKIAE